jgi:hypothetical protein
MKARKCIPIVLVVLSLGIFFPTDAHAYLDPGTGSYVLQLALAALVGALFAIRMFWGRIKVLFGNLLSRQENDVQTQGE